MKKLWVVCSTLLALSSAYAQQDVVTKAKADLNALEVEELSDNFVYIGVGVSSMALNDDATKEEYSALSKTIQIGFQVGEYMAVEGRYISQISSVKYSAGTTANVDNDDVDTDFSNIGIYFKPIYPIERFAIYGLLGYGRLELTNLVDLTGVVADHSVTSFQWGLGMKFNVMDRLIIYGDYMSLYNNSGFGTLLAGTDVGDTVTFGLSYRF
ncbi:MAG: outer membrane beta-barrel protein [Campylobacterales bacterium]|nr:outer membrane beta-barrel protein [Campylobacterales bacterium]